MHHESRFLAAAPGARTRALRLAAIVALCCLTLPATVDAQVTWEDDEEDAEKLTGFDVEAERAEAETNRKKKRCPDGMVINQDTRGQCCWPGQAWNGEECVGTPAYCPDGLVSDADLQACVAGKCPQHKVPSQDGEHCCWPGQAWSSSHGRCVGTPECPVHHSRKGETCVYSPPDSDNDGLIDEKDMCPFRAEDVDDFEDNDGCPDRDNDGDLIADAGDRCPDQKEDVDTWEDADGCPDVDNDGDGILDENDTCALRAEDIDGFEDEDGCPDDDNDGDGLVDANDTCPNAPEDANDYDDTDGCPDEPQRHKFVYNVAGGVVLGLGVALGATSLGLHLVAQNLREDVESPSSGNPFGANDQYTQVEAQQAETDANRLDTTAAVLVGVGGAAVVTGSVLLIWAWAGAEEVPEVGGVSGAVDDESAMLLWTVPF